ncbi:hypothetical protein D3C73_1403430 [compost metagenome]
MKPKPTICSLALDDALNSTGSVTTWNRTAALKNRMPSRIRPLNLNKNPPIKRNGATPLAKFTRGNIRCLATSIGYRTLSWIA